MVVDKIMEDFALEGELLADWSKMAMTLEGPPDPSRPL